MRYDSQPDEGIRGAPPARSGGITTVLWVLAILAAIALFAGLFILFAGDNQSIGLGGELSWRVGDIDAAWAYGLLGSGAVVLLAAAATLIRLGKRS